MRKDDFQTQRTEISAKYNIDYYYEEANNPKELWVLLHGYSESSFHIVKRLKPIIPNDVVVLAPNGPFPLPTKTQTTYKMGYAWYFYDAITDNYFIDFSIACSIINGLIDNLNLNHLPIRIIGYSQGGYLAPFLALSLEKTLHAIGINSSTRVDFIKDDFHFQFDQIHGTEDEFVEMELAEKRFKQLENFKNKGSFYKINNQSHYLSRDYLPTLEKIIKQIK